MIKIDESMMRRLRNHNWDRTLRSGYDMAVESLRLDAQLMDHHIGFALLRQAAFVSRVAYPSPPRSAWPTSSSMPDAPDDVTQWQLISAYLQGSLTSLPHIENRPPRPTAAQVDRCDVILYLWHTFALRRKGDRSRIKRAVYMKANGVRPQVIQRISNITPLQLRRAQAEAGEDIMFAIDRFRKK